MANDLEDLATAKELGIDGRIAELSMSATQRSYAVPKVSLHGPAVRSSLPRQSPLATALVCFRSPAHGLANNMPATPSNPCKPTMQKLLALAKLSCADIGYVKPIDRDGLNADDDELLVHIIYEWLRKHGFHTLADFACFAKAFATASCCSLMGYSKRTSWLTPTRMAANRSHFS